MVLRLFSKSKKVSADAGGKATAGAQRAAAVPGDNAGPDELASAVRTAGSNKERATLIGRINDVATLKSLSQHSGCLALCADQLASVASVNEALLLATTPQARRELLLGAHKPELRNAGLQAITSEAELVDLEHASRSKNKACNRAARERLDRLRNARSSATQAAATADELATAATSLGRDSAIPQKDEILQARFNALAQKHEVAAQELAASTAILADYAEAAPALTPMPLAPAMDATDNDDEGPDFKALSARFKALQQQLESGAPTSQLTQDMHSAGNDWRDAIAAATPDASAIDQVTSSTALFEKVGRCEALLAERADDIATAIAQPASLTPADLQALPRKELAAAWKQVEQADSTNKTIRQLSSGLNYPAKVQAPAVIEQLAARAKIASDLVNAGKARQSELENSFQTQVKRLADALDAGELKQAEAARGEARALQEALPGGAANATRKRFGTLLANMQNLRDWQHFATDPKREELCTQMAALAENPVEPDEQADQVKALRAQWNALGGKGPKELAERFDKAAAQAFEPCRLHYAVLAEQRTANIATRKSILTQLETFVSATDWADTDLAAARTILNSARTEWRNAFPVERGANRSLEKSFKTVTDELYAKLQDGWSGNLATKEKLVETAEAMLNSEEPLQARLESAKRLQQQWKDAGPVPRGPDQKLWKRFRAACDALFNTRDEERNQAQAESAAQQTAAKARLTEFATLLEATAAVDVDRSQLTAMKQDLEEFDNLDRSIIRQARDLEDQFKAKLKTKASAKKQATLTALKELDVLAAAAEAAGNELPAQVLEGDKVFASRKAPAQHAHLDLVIEAETQAGIESPASDGQRRLELQVQWLNAGMNSGARKSSDALELARRWCELTATSDSDSRRERLFAAANALL